MAIVPRLIPVEFLSAPIIGADAVATLPMFAPSREVPQDVDLSSELEQLPYLPLDSEECRARLGLKKSEKDWDLL